nr:VPS10 domain-containing receptor SorCS1-like [Oncorhynchus nerka]
MRGVLVRYWMERLGRSEFKWNTDERRGTSRGEASASKGDDPKLTSTTFALTGDTTIQWFSVWDKTAASTDYGSTYERMNDKVGSKTVLSYLYVCPSNKRKIMVLTDPEIESSVLISSDERVSYQKYRLSFYILILLFHPTQEDWALGYSHDQKNIGGGVATSSSSTECQRLSSALPAGSTLSVLRLFVTDFTPLDGLAGVGVVPETAGVRLDGPASVGDFHLGSTGSQSESLGL